MAPDLHVTLRHAMYIVGCIVALILVLNHIFPAPQPVHAPVAVASANPVEREISALEKSQNQIVTTLNGVVSLTQRPGATIIHDVVPGFTLAQSSAVAGATKPVTQTQVSAQSKLISPTPAPMPSDDLSKTIFTAAYAADTRALYESHLHTDVTLSQVEAPRSLFGSAFVADGSTGLSFSAWRRKQFEANIVATLQNNHAEPGICPAYMIPHTALAPELCFMAGNGFHIALGATENF